MTVTAINQVLFISAPSRAADFVSRRGRPRKTNRRLVFVENRMRRRIAALFLVSCLGLSAEAAGEANGELAARSAHYFQEAKALCERDAGKLWGKSLCGPILLADPESRTVFANEGDREHQLEARGGLFVGKLPASVNIANTATEWAGTKWTMLGLPLPADAERRAALLVHELWHRVQDQLGFPSSSAANNHLDTRDGRYWLQLEWRALAAAVASKGESRQWAILDAEIFRAQRRSLFPASANEERSMEMHEGLAEYTGVRLGTVNPNRFVVTSNLKEAPEKRTFVRSFAYAAGPAYGLLLDDVSPGWRKSVRAQDDLGALLLAACKFTLPEDIAAKAEERAQAYDGVALGLSEDKRERERRQQEQTYLARLVEGPVLVIPLRKMNMQFDPRTVVPLAQHGSVYPTIRIVDVWGVLEVKQGGALMAADFSKITVPAPTDVHGQHLKTDGWTLELNANWLIEPAQRPGSYALRETNN